MFNSSVFTSGPQQLFGMLLAITLLPGLANADHNEEEIASILTELEENRRAVVAENMALNEKDSAVFWGVYDTYRGEIAEVQKQGMTLLREFHEHFEEITDDRANQVMATYFNLEIRTLEIRQAYVSKFNEVISPKQTLRFYQIENKLDSIIQADVSSVTPLVAD